MRIAPRLTAFALVAAVFTMVGAAWQSQQAEIQYYGSSPTRPFSNAVRAGNTVYLSGQIGRGEGIEAQTRASLESIKTRIEEVGGTMDDVVKCLVMLADMSDFSGMNSVYTTYFTKHRPARSAFGASGLAANARIEIECIAVLGARNAD
jgi:2-iminobutanoate/2-iminopropanoate deaminase